MLRLRGFPLVLAVMIAAHLTGAAQPHKYFIQNSGKSSNTGLSDAQAWDFQTLQSKTLNAGDTVAFQCGFTTSAGFVANQSGVIYTWYGTGPRPLFKNPSGGQYGNAITISGSNIILDGIQTDTAGFGGVYVSHGSDYNIVRNCEVKHAGMSIEVYGRHNLVTRNYVHHPHMVVNDVGGNNDYGADGITCWNSYNEVSWNQIDSCYAPSYDYGEDGGGLGIFAGANGENADSCYFHHNMMIDDDQMSEISSSGGQHIYGFVESYNVYINTHSGVAPLDIHLDGTFGADVKGMRFENNTIYAIHPTFQYDDAIKWGGTATMTPAILTLTNNIIRLGNFSVLMAKDHLGLPGLSHNIYWNPQSEVSNEKSLPATNSIVDPLFVSPWANLRLQSGSPAVNNGVSLSAPGRFSDPNLDLDGHSFVGAQDAGAYEYQGTSPPSPTPPAVVTSAATNIAATGVQLNGSITPKGYSTAYHFEFGPSAAYGTSTPGANAGSGSVAVGVSATLSALTPATVYHYRLVGTSVGGTTAGTDMTFTTAASTPAPAPPIVASTAAANLSTTGAQLNGTVNPNGSGTTYHFEFGPSAAYGTSTPAGTAGSGSAIVNVNSAVSGLNPGTKYHFRLVAVNPVGTSNSSDVTFSTPVTQPAPTPPIVATLSAGAITTTSVQIAGSVNPNGYSTSYHFEYGPTAAYGASTPVGDAGSGSVPVGVSASLTNLSNGTLYHYRLVATSSAGTIAGSDSSFMTAPVVISSSTEACDLQQNYPNPFNPATQIDFELRVAGDASLKVYNTIGVEVLTLISGFQTAGKHTVQWNARGLASGIYFCTLQSGGTLSTRRMILLR